LILRVSASDADQNKTVSYSIRASKDVKKLISVSQLSGEIVVANRIDHEVTSWINFTVKATDSGVPPRSSIAQVSIKVIDQNDNPPEFTHPVLNVTVREDTPPGTVIALLEAIDGDSGEFGKVRSI